MRPHIILCTVALRYHSTMVSSHHIYDTVYIIQYRTVKGTKGTVQVQVQGSATVRYSRRYRINKVRYDAQGL